MQRTLLLIAVAVAAIAHEHGIATRPRVRKLHAEVSAFMYEPGYAI